MNNTAGSKTITGLNPLANVDCDELNINSVITIEGGTPNSKQFLAYTPATGTTIYSPVDPASDLDITSLTELTATTSNDKLLIYDSSTGENRKISPENIDPNISITATQPLSINVGDMSLNYNSDLTVYGSQLGLFYNTISGVSLGSNLKTLTITMPDGTQVDYDGASAKAVTIADTTYTVGTGLSLVGTQISFSGGDLGGVDVTIRGSLNSTNTLVTTGAVFMYNLPTKEVNADVGQLWNDNGNLKIGT